jgi:hypothetical protein
MTSWIIDVITTTTTTPPPSLTCSCGMFYSKVQNWTGLNLGWSKSVSFYYSAFWKGALSQNWFFLAILNLIFPPLRVCQLLLGCILGHTWQGTGPLWMGLTHSFCWHSHLMRWHWTGQKWEAGANRLLFQKTQCQHLRKSGLPCLPPSVRQGQPTGKVGPVRKR